MALFTLATATGLIDVLEGYLSMPLEGAWIAYLGLGADEAPALGAAALLIAREDGEPLRFVGTLVVADLFEGRVHVELVAGTGGLASPAAPLHFSASPTPIPALTLIAAIVSSAGEQLADGIGLTGRTAARWTRVAGETWGQALGRVADRYGLAWRFLDTGVIWIGEEAWPAVGASLAPTLLDDELRARVLHVAFDAATARPGTVIHGRRITRVTYWADGHGELQYDDSDADLLRGLLSRYAKPSPYSRTYDAEVISQNTDGTIDVRLLNGPVTDLHSIPFVSGLLGGRFVIGGGVVRVAFIEARLDGAFAYAISGDDAATAGVARVGDRVNCGTLAVSMAGPSPVLVYTPPGAAPLPASAVVSLEGIIESGSEEVFIR